MVDRANLHQCLLDTIRINAATGCWEWTGSSARGYGLVKVDGKTKRAHRASYECHHGPIPDGMCVCHRCDNRGCINPEHLFLGTNAENVADRNAKRRQAYGSAHGNAKLTEDDAIAIRNATGFLQRELAEKYGVNRTVISNIRLGLAWTHIGSNDK